MFMAGNFLYALAIILDKIISIYTWIIIIRALISWVSPDPYNTIVQILHRLTEPVLGPIRRMVPLGNIGIDLSPLIAILLLYFAQLFVVRTLIDLAMRLR